MISVHDKNLRWLDTTILILIFLLKMRQNLISMFKYANQPEKAKFSVLKSHGLDWAYQGKIDDVSENTQQKHVMKNPM